MALTFIEAAMKILEQEGGPLHFKEITQRALSQGLIQTTGKTPWQSMGAQLYTRIKTDEEAGRPPAFTQAGRGLFALARKEKQQRGLAGLVNEARQKARLALLEKLKAVSPRRFEELIGLLLAKIGFEDVEVTQASGDGGIDAFGRLTVGGITNVRTAVQAKRWSHNVPDRIVREMRGSLRTGERGTIITTAEFTKAAKLEASAEGKEPISIIDGQKLVDLLVQHELGVKKRTVELLELNLSILEDVDEGASEEEDAGPLPATIHPLPGSSQSHVETLLEILRFIGLEGTERSEVLAWLQQRYQGIKQQRSAEALIGTLRRSGFIEYDGERLKPTEEALLWMNAPTGSSAVKILERHILGFQEIRIWLEEGPKTMAELHEMLTARYPHLDWGSSVGVRIRLTYLKKFGLVSQRGEKYQLALTPTAKVHQ